MKSIIILDLLKVHPQTYERLVATIHYYLNFALVTADVRSRKSTYYFIIPYYVALDNLNDYINYILLF